MVATRASTVAVALCAMVCTLHYLATWRVRPFPTAHNHAAPLFVAAMSTSGRHVLSPPLRCPLCWCRLTRLLHLRVCAWCGGYDRGHGCGVVVWSTAAVCGLQTTLT